MSSLYWNIEAVHDISAFQVSYKFVSSNKLEGQVKPPFLHYIKDHHASSFSPEWFLSAVLLESLVVVFPSHGPVFLKCSKMSPRVQWIQRLNWFIVGVRCISWFGFANLIEQTKEVQVERCGVSSTRMATLFCGGFCYPTTSIASNEWVQ